ncbi:hypothetical protein KY285_007591 [Solanum tuberosum]|nr:hypothetical protein KY284_007667 [Solanum tuberosum]KAH0745934.1 hypothetical protein KY285_007591 [Solanum tuberosum]
MVTWTLDFNPEEEKSLAPIWITLPSLKWHYFNWDALLPITSTIGTLLKIDKATNAKEFEKCDSSDEDALIDAFPPKTSRKGEKVEDAVSQHRQSLINNGNLSPRLVSRNANVNHKDFAKPGPITRAMGKTFQIAIQEPFVDACHIDKYRKGLGFEGCSSNCNGKIWILWSNEIHIDVAKDNEQQLTLKVTNKSNAEIVWFTVVYAKSKQHLRLPLWDSLRNCNNFIDEPWCICGDFNAIMSPDEKKGG